MIRAIALLSCQLLTTGIAHAQEGSAAAALPYPIVDTGQVKCYNASGEIACPAAGAAFYGQDAQITGRAPSYTNNGNGTVTDNVTGLMWQRSPDLNGDGQIRAADKLTYEAAVSYCENLTLAGLTDWRLPDIKQLYSLIQFNGMDPSGFNGTDTSGLTPFISRAYFDFAYGDTAAGERIIDAQYASSTKYVASTANDGGLTVFGVNFADGRIKGYGSRMPGGGSKTFFVQCVRGNAGYGVNAFVDNNDQTITDQATGLMWARSDSGSAMNWQSALAWVQTHNAASYLGHNDWRLPNAKELQGILDYTRSPATTHSAALAPAINATAFVNEGGQNDWPWYWTSTTHASSNGMGASGVYISFGRAGGWQKATPSASCYTLYDVHGAGAQRSDPKTTAGVVLIGPACSGGTANGLGPQGDAQRAVNYVRLVRDARAAQSHLIFPMILNGAGQSAGLAVANYSNASAALTFKAYSNSGTLLGSAQRSLEPRRQLAQLFSQLFPAVVETPCWLIVESNTPEARGFFLLFDDAVTWMDGAAASSKALSGFVLPLAEDGRISLVNPGSGPANYSLDYVGEAGGVQGNVQGTLPAYGRTVVPAASLRPAAAAGGYVRGSSSGAAVLQTFGGPNWLGALGALDSDAAYPAVQFAPQYVAGGGFTSSLDIVNLERSTQTLVLSMVGDNGQALGRAVTVSLAASGSARINGVDPFGLAAGASLMQGYVRLESNGGKYAGAVRFSDPQGRIFGSALGFTGAGATTALFSHVAQNDLYYTGVAAINPNAQAVEVSVEVYNGDGTLVASGAQSVPPGGRFSRLLRQLAGSFGPMTQGYFKVSAAQPVNAFALFGTSSGDVLAAIPPQ